MPGPTFGKGVDHRYGGDVCAGCFHGNGRHDESLAAKRTFVGRSPKPCERAEQTEP